LNRRDFLKLLAVFAISSYLGSSNSVKKNKIVIVGAGIIGITLAYELSKAGANVVLLDKKYPGSQASGNTFAWINATYPKTPYAYNLFSQLGMEAYRVLEKEAELKIKWSGSLEWFNDKQLEKDTLKKVKSLMTYKRYSPVNIISGSQAEKIEPGFNYSDAKVIFSKSDGAIDIDDALIKIVKKIKLFGGKLIYPCEYQSSNFANGKLKSLNTTIGEIQADKVIFTAGIDSNKLVGRQVLQEATPGIIMKSKPHDKLMEKMIIGPGIHLHQQMDGVIVFGEQAGAPPTHGDRLKYKPNKFPPGFGKDHAERMIQNTNFFLKNNLELEVADISIGWRPLPKDGQPIIGWLPNQPDSYIATMHSGVSLAAITAQIVAMEILDGSSNKLLNNFRPTRFF